MRAPCFTHQLYRWMRQMPRRMARSYFHTPYCMWELSLEHYPRGMYLPRNYLSYLIRRRHRYHPTRVGLTHGITDGVAPEEPNGISFYDSKEDNLVSICISCIKGVHGGYYATTVSYHIEPVVNLICFREPQKLRHSKIGEGSLHNHSQKVSAYLEE